MQFKIGQGFDVHAFGEGDHVILGGVKIPFNKGLVAHSDGDVVIHAICDGILGAMALGDIGDHFPDSDPKFSNICSMNLLGQVNSLSNSKGWHIGNIDVTIIAQEPRISKYKQQMSTNIAETLNCDLNCINIKGTTTENLGFIGRNEGIAVQAIVLLCNN